MELRPQRSGESSGLVTLALEVNKAFHDADHRKVYWDSPCSPLTLIYKWEHLEALAFARNSFKKNKIRRGREKKKNKVPQVCWAICLVCFLHLSSLSSQQMRMRKVGYWKQRWGKCVSLQRKTEKKTSICWQIKAGLRWHLNDRQDCGDLESCQDLWSTRGMGKGRFSSPTLGCDFPVTAFVPFCCRN